MHETSRRRIVLNNLTYDCVCERLPRHVVRALVAAVTNAWAVEREGIAPESLIARVADAYPEIFLCRGLSHHLDVCQCSRVVDVYTWVKNVLDLSRLGFILTDEVPDRVIKRWEFSFPIDLVRDDCKAIRGARPFAWVTKTESIKALTLEEDDDQNNSALATLARDHLGLRHYASDEKIIEIRYPSDATKKLLQLAPPTFVEGAPELVYRSLQSSDGWGRAVHIQSKEPGLPEAVHPPVELSADFRLIYLGRIKGTNSLTWEDLEVLCPMRLPLDDIVSILHEVMES